MDERFLEAASEREQRERELGVKMVQAANQPETHPDYDGIHCVDCDAEIPAQRRAMGKVRCVMCQHLKEKRHAHTRQ